MAEKTPLKLVANEAGASTADKAKALDSALSQIERSFGKGAIMRLGSKDRLAEVETIPTGCLGLDIALGVGGLPRGRVIEIYGPESSGKCVTADTHVLSDAGLLSIAELFALKGKKATCTSRIEEVEAGLVNERGEVELTSHFTWNNRKPVKVVETSLGLRLKETFKHPIRVMDANGFVVWRNGGQVAVGDHAVVMRGTGVYGSTDLATTEEATLLGFLVADGCNVSEARVAFSNSDPDIVAEFAGLAASMAPRLEMRSYPKADTATIDHHVNDREWRTDLAGRLGLDYVLSAQKTVPLSIRSSGEGVQRAFLRAYLELECSLDPKKRLLEVASASRVLLEQVQLMLLNMGRIGTLDIKPVDGTDYWRLTYSGSEGAALVRDLGFRSAARLAVAATFAEESRGSTNIDSIPNIGGLLRSLYESCDVRSREADDLLGDCMDPSPRANVTYPRLARIVTFFEEVAGPLGHPLLTHLRELLRARPFFSKIVSITDEEHPTFDVCMPRTHSFWSNGLVSHNTTLMLHVIAEAQKRGGVCAFVDAEHALDPVYARKLGVNVDDLLISQPDNGEQALEITDTLVRSGAIDVLVIDSVAALTPRAELDGEMGDSQPGLQARLMSQALRKLTASISKSNTMVVFINQIRMKIGVMYGSPETTTGGNALKFYASVRLDIRRIGAIKDGDETIGNQTRVKVVKNKVAPPFRQAEFDILYGVGVSRHGELIDLGVKAGVVEKSGSWYSHDSQRLGQGKEKTRDFLIAHPEVSDAIEKAIRGQTAALADRLLVGPSDDAEA